jgi:hypothetical protein
MPPFLSSLGCQPVQVTYHFVDLVFRTAPAFWALVFGFFVLAVGLRFATFAVLANLQVGQMRIKCHEGLSTKSHPLFPVTIGTSFSSGLKL